jgi:hypothetical protein
MLKACPFKAMESSNGTGLATAALTQQPLRALRSTAATPAWSSAAVRCYRRRRWGLVAADVEVPTPRECNTVRGRLQGYPPHSPSLVRLLTASEIFPTMAADDAGQKVGSRSGMWIASLLCLALTRTMFG